jgi:hypothetical protein
MKDLIEALTILLKYGDPANPLNCNHDEVIICGIDPKDVSDEDKKKLDDLGFFVSDGEGYADETWFMSHRFGSC